MVSETVARVYRGRVANEQCHVTVHDMTGQVIEPLPPRNDLANHSPDGFQWGYGGSGPAQLALALLAYELGDDALALKHYQRFKWEHIAQLPFDGSFEMTGHFIREMVRLLESGQ